MVTLKKPPPDYSGGGLPTSVALLGGDVCHLAASRPTPYCRVLRCQSGSKPVGSMHLSLVSSAKPRMAPRYFLPLSSSAPHDVDQVFDLSLVDSKRPPPSCSEYPEPFLPPLPRRSMTVANQRGRICGKARLTSRSTGKSRLIIMATSVVDSN